MIHKRASDTREGTYFRSNRMIRENGKWFFLTRESTVEGPYETEHEAQTYLSDYIKRMKSINLAAGEKFTLQPM
jgi:Domain of unknown function (DUF6316)